MLYSCCRYRSDKESAVNLLSFITTPLRSFLLRSALNGPSLSVWMSVRVCTCVRVYECKRTICNDGKIVQQCRNAEIAHLLCILDILRSLNVRRELDEKRVSKANNAIIATLWTVIVITLLTSFCLSPKMNRDLHGVVQQYCFRCTIYPAGPDPFCRASVLPSWLAAVSWSHLSRLTSNNNNGIGQQTQSDKLAEFCYGFEQEQ